MQVADLRAEPSTLTIAVQFLFAEPLTPALAVVELKAEVES